MDVVWLLRKHFTNCSTMYTARGLPSAPFLVPKVVGKDTEGSLLQCCGQGGLGRLKAET